MSASMTLHCGARYVTPEELSLVPCPTPEPGSHWKPVPHSTVLRYALNALSEASYEVQEMKLGLSRNDQRFWGTLVLKSAIVEGVQLSVAVASSIDQSISLRWGYGHRVWICDNGAWSVEKTIAKKHTTHSVERYREAICLAVKNMEGYREVEAQRIRSLVERPLTDTEAESFLLRCYEAKLLSAQNLPTAIRQWRTPSYPDFEPRTAWSAYNAVTYALNPRAKSNPQAHASATIRLNALLAPN